MADNQKILLVDDDLTLVEMYSERLKAAGYKVEVAHDGQACLDIVKQNKPDLILLDIMMPKMNGLDVLKTLKADPATANIPVVLLTALIQELDKVKAITNQAVEYYVKSETMPGALIKQISRILSEKDEQSDAKSS